MTFMQIGTKPDRNSYGYRSKFVYIFIFIALYLLYNFTLLYFFYFIHHLHVVKTACGSRQSPWIADEASDK